jgi:drug/metabolite transporter (DMT)-like permease
MTLAFIGGVIVGISDSCSLQFSLAQFQNVMTGQTAGESTLHCPPFKDFITGEAFVGDALALAGALAAAGYLLIGRQLREKISLVPYVFVVYGMAAVVLVIWMLASGGSPIGHSPKAYLWILLLALVPQVLGHSIFNWALRYLSAAYVSITLLGEPIGSAILAYFLLSEVPSGLMVFGAILILAGILVSSRSEG